MIEADHYTTEALRRMSAYDWELTLSIMPRVCNRTSERIPMFSYAYRGQRTIHGPGSPVYLIRWITSETYLFEKIKGNLL